MKDYERLTNGYFECSRCEKGICKIPNSLCTYRLYCEIYNHLADLEDKIESGEIDYVADKDKEIARLTEENAELTRKVRELEQELAGSIKIPFKVIDKTTGKQADEGYISKNEDWAQHLIYCDMDGFAVTQDGNIILLDETGKFVYCPFERFEIVKEEDE